MFAHAYYDDEISPDQQNSHMCMWYRMDDWMTYPNKHQGFQLMHGHTPRKNGPIVSGNRINIDTGAYSTGRLCVAQFVEGTIGPIRMFDVEINKEVDSAY